jgi:hypothetical protein
MCYMWPTIALRRILPYFQSMLNINLYSEYASSHCRIMSHHVISYPRQQLIILVLSRSHKMNQDLPTVACT